MANLYGYAEEERAVATIEAAFDSPVNFIDTSNGYCENGTAETSDRHCRPAPRGLPPHVVLATKVDPDLDRPGPAR
jgi:D-threo-aldose 1-dehydrogenase